MAAVPLALLFAPALGPWPMLAGPGLLILTVAWLALPPGPGPAARWQLRYDLPSNADASALDRLEGVLAFLVDRGHHLVLEAGDGGLILAVPEPLGHYVAVQLPRALPQAKITALPPDEGHRPGTVFLATGPLPAAEVLRWATRRSGLGEGRRVRLHVRDGRRVTLVAGGVRPPGPWRRVPGPAGRRLWHAAPLWDDLPAGTRLSDLLPITRADSAFSSRSRLLELAPPAAYEAAAGRCLGQTTDGRSLTAGDETPLFLTGAPTAYLARLAVEDHRCGLTPVVLSPHRRVLERIAHQVEDAVWIDAEDSAATGHLALVPAGEWETVGAGSATRLAQGFLADAGVDLSLDATRTVVRYLTYVLATSARLTGNDFSFVDLYAVSQGIPALRAFLCDLGQLFPDQEQPLHRRAARFEALLDTDAGYVQAVTALSALRAALEPLRAGPLHNLAQPPYLDVGAALAAGQPLLVPLTNRDYPAHDRLLVAMVDLTLARLLGASGPALRFALHLHAPHRFRRDGGARWIDATRAGQVAALVSSDESRAYAGLYARETDAELIFSYAAGDFGDLAGDEALPCTANDLADLPAGTAIARLPGLSAVALQTDGDR